MALHLLGSSVLPSVVVDTGVAEEDMLLRWPHLALQAGQEEQALQAAAAACQALPKSTAVWEQSLSLQARHATLQVFIRACPVQPPCPSGVPHESARAQLHVSCMPVSKHLLTCECACNRHVCTGMYTTCCTSMQKVAISCRTQAMLSV